MSRVGHPFEEDVSSPPPAFEPWERFMMLSNVLLEDLAPEEAAELLPMVTSTAMLVVRQVMGQRTRAEAFFAIEGLRRSVDTVRRRSS